MSVQTTSCSFANKYIAKAAHDKPETQRYKNPNADSKQTAFQMTVKQVDAAAFQANILYNKGW